MFGRSPAPEGLLTPDDLRFRLVRCVLIFRNAPHFRYLGSFEDYGASRMSATRGSPCEPCNDPSEGLRVEVAFDVFDEYYGPRGVESQHYLEGPI